MKLNEYIKKLQPDHISYKPTLDGSYTVTLSKNSNSLIVLTIPSCQCICPDGFPQTGVDYDANAVEVGKKTNVN